MSGSEKRLEETRGSCGMEEEDEEDKASNSVPEPMKSDWMLSLRRPGCSRLCTGVKMPGGRRSVHGMMGYRRWRWFLEGGNAGKDGQEEFLHLDEVNCGKEDELKGLGFMVCSTAVILPGQKGNNRLVYSYKEIPLHLYNKIEPLCHHANTYAAIIKPTEDPTHCTDHILHKHTQLRKCLKVADKHNPSKNKHTLTLMT